jgi:sigma-B regulation protein RsbU (phosphoserine phosphatase)
MNVFIAEDDPVSRRLLCALLQSWGHEVTAATDGEEAWALLRQRTEPCVAILDWMMPGLDGPELCRRMRLTPALRGSYVILLTSRSGRTSVVDGLESGADDFLAKPFDGLELRARLAAGMRVLGLQVELSSRVKDLQAALDTVQRLRGLLPICACCKRIRNGDDYWQQVEEYVCAHADVQFTHGLCPDCVAREVAALAG